MRPNETLLSEPSPGAAKLRRQQEAAILALLDHATTRQAAQAAGVSEGTLWRWLQSEVFRRAYLRARREVVRHAMAQIQRSAGEAVQVLREVMTNPQEAAGVRLSAAKAVLDYAVKTLEVEDLEQRVCELEAQAERQPERRQP